MAQVNKKLYDVLTRHQIYLEGVKAFYQKDFNSTLKELEKEFRYIFAKKQYVNLDSMTKSTLLLFLGEIRKTQSRIYSAYTQKLIKQIEAFVYAENKVSKIIYASIAVGELVTEDQADSMLEKEESGTLPIGWLLGGSLASAKLWSYIKNAPIPANGIVLEQFVKDFANTSALGVENAIRKGYANKEKTEAVLQSIIGTSSNNFRDGILNRTNSQSGAVIETAIQHVSSIVQAGVSSVFSKRYQWISVIDNVTTQVCRSRNLQIYEYGKGPLPPAHIRCRSKVMPVVGEPNYDAPVGYFEWLKTQPDSILDDILGKSKAGQFKAGELSKKDLPQFESPIPISLAEFENKLKFILQ